MTPDDLAMLHAKCFEMPRPWTADEFASLLTAKGVFLHVGPVGFALAREIAGETELLTLAVDPASQRQGHGKQLLNEFESVARNRGATVVFLEVAASNIGARTLYRRAGYSESGHRKGYYKPPFGPRIDAILLRKSLI